MAPEQTPASGSGSGNPTPNPAQTPPATAPGPSRDPGGRFAPPNPQKSGGDGAGLSEAQLSSARARWVAAGHDPARFDAAMGGTAPLLPRVPVPDLTDTSRPVYVGGNDPIGMSGEQSLAMARALEKAGVPVERIQAAMAADGVTPPKETLTPEQIAHNRQWHLDAAHMPPIAAYRPDFRTALGDSIGGYTPAQLAEFRQESSEWASKLALPVKLGEGLVERALHVWQRLEQMTPDQRRTWSAEQRSQLMKTSGMPATTAMKVLDLAPGAFHDRLKASGALNDAFIVRSLANWGAHLSRYQQSKGGPK